MPGTAGRLSFARRPYVAVFGVPAYIQETRSGPGDALSARLPSRVTWLQMDAALRRDSFLRSPGYRMGMRPPPRTELASAHRRPAGLILGDTAAAVTPPRDAS